MTETITRRSLGEWSEIIHEWALEKGWWEDVNRNVGEIILLFVGEVSETFEEWRDGRSMTRMYFNQEDARQPIVYEDDENIPERINKKPEGIPIEMADIFIRILDVCPMWEIDIDSMLELTSRQPYIGRLPGGLTDPPVNVGHALMTIVYEFSMLFHSWARGEGLNQVTWSDPGDGRRTTGAVPGAVASGFPIHLARILLMLMQLCNEWRIDILRYIQIKHEYNKTRPHRHGNKKA